MFYLHLYSKYSLDSYQTKTFTELVKDPEAFELIDPSFLEANFEYNGIVEDRLRILHSNEFSVWKDTIFVYHEAQNDGNNQLLVSFWRPSDEFKDNLLRIDFTTTNKYFEYSDTLADQLVDQAHQIEKSDTTQIEKEEIYRELDQGAFELLHDIKFQFHNESSLKEKIKSFIQQGIHYAKNQ